VSTEDGAALDARDMEVGSPTQNSRQEKISAYVSNPPSMTPLCGTLTWIGPDGQQFEAAEVGCESTGLIGCNSTSTQSAPLGFLGLLLLFGRRKGDCSSNMRQP